MLPVLATQMIEDVLGIGQACLWVGSAHAREATRLEGSPWLGRLAATGVVGSSSSHKWLIALAGGLTGGSDHISNDCPGHPSVPSASDGIKDMSFGLGLFSNCVSQGR